MTRMIGRKIASAMLPPSIWWEGSVVWATGRGRKCVTYVWEGGTFLYYRSGPPTSDIRVMMMRMVNSQVRMKHDTRE